LRYAVNLAELKRAKSASGYLAVKVNPEWAWGGSGCKPVQFLHYFC